MKEKGRRMEKKTKKQKNCQFDKRTLHKILCFFPSCPTVDNAKAKNYGK